MIFHSNNNPDSLLGLTLVELLVAMAISSILLLGIGSIYSSTKRAYRVQDEFGRIQENARYALHTISKDVRMAGYQGCSNLTFIQAINHVDPSLLSLLGQIEFNDATFIIGHSSRSGSITPPLAKPVTIVKNTDAITLQKASSCTATVLTPVTAKSTRIRVTNRCNFKQNEIVMITNCQTTDIFKISNVPIADRNGIVTLEPAINTLATQKLRSYNDDAQIHKFERLSYYIKINAQTGNPSLHKMSIGVNKNMPNSRMSIHETFIADNVQDMRIDYGIDLDYSVSMDSKSPGADEFLSAADINAKGLNTDGEPFWANVVSVRLQMLFQSNEIGKVGAPGARGHQRKYTFLGKEITAPGDTKLRQAFVTTINLRNRTP